MPKYIYEMYYVFLQPNFPSLFLTKFHKWFRFLIQIEMLHDLLNIEFDKSPGIGSNIVNLFVGFILKIFDWKPARGATDYISFILNFFFSFHMTS